MELMQPKSDDPAQQQSNVILKFLPLMIGWFSLSVPAALSVYWVTNNIVTTATSLWIRNSMKVEAPSSGGSATATMNASAQTIFSPPREKPSGFGDRPSPAFKDGVKPITAIEAEIVEDVDEEDESSSGEGSDVDKSGSKRKRRKTGGKKKKN